MKKNASTSQTSVTTMEATAKSLQLSLVIQERKNQFEIVEKTFRGNRSKQFPSKQLEENYVDLERAHLNAAMSAIRKGGHIQNIEYLKRLVYEEKKGDTIIIYLYIAKGNSHNMVPTLKPDFWNKDKILNSIETTPMTKWVMKEYFNIK